VVVNAFNPEEVENRLNVSLKKSFNCEVLLWSLKNRF